MSLCEAECIAPTSTTTQVIWLVWLLKDLKQEETKPVELKVDNKSALGLMKMFFFHERNKHICVRCNYVRQCMEEDSVHVELISTNDQLADIGIKALERVRFQEFHAKIGMVHFKPKLKHKTYGGELLLVSLVFSLFSEFIFLWSQ
jgi:hypothetical protein